MTRNDRVYADEELAKRILSQVETSSLKEIYATLTHLLVFIASCAGLEPDAFQRMMNDVSKQYLELYVKPNRPKKPNFWSMKE